MPHNAFGIMSIPNGQTKSGSVQSCWGTANAGKVALDNADMITIRAPAALTGVATVQVAFTNPSVDADFNNYQETVGTDLVIAAGKAVRFFAPGVSDIRIISSLAEGAQRDFTIGINENI